LRIAGSGVPWAAQIPFFYGYFYMCYDKLSDKKVRASVFEKYNGRCAYCGCKLDARSFTIDHIIPLRRHEKNPKIIGINSIKNYNPCCYSCNSSKSTFTVEKWREQISLKINVINRDSPTYRILKRFNLVKETNNDVIFYYEKHPYELNNVEEAQ
jgi:5-methylcytosine-specific restriction endonuclease McrA